MLRFLERERIFPFDRPRENFVLYRVLIDGECLPFGNSSKLDNRSPRGSIQHRNTCSHDILVRLDVRKI